jgi:hypothetical protein
MTCKEVKFDSSGMDMTLPYSFYTGKSNFSTRATDPEERNNFLARTELASDLVQLKMKAVRSKNPTSGK